jgi:hypothetical protein
VTHILETFLAEDGVQQASDGRVVGHPVGFAEARQGGGRWCDFAISCAIFLRGTRKLGALDLVCSSAGLEGKPSIREVGAGEFFCAGRKWGHRARQ